MNDNHNDSKFLTAIYQNAEERKEQLKQDLKENNKTGKQKMKASLLSVSDNTKESKFFDAINQDAQEHMAQISREIEAYKNEKIEQATEQGLNDAYELIRADVTKRTAAIVNGVAKKQIELKNSLYAERESIREEVFHRAEERLRSFAASDEYIGFLNASLDKIAQFAGDGKCTVYIAPSDEDKRSLIEAKLPGAEIKADNHILIGGVKAHIPAEGIMLDDTLDTRLSDQYAWFNENSGLKVV